MWQRLYLVSLLVIGLALVAISQLVVRPRIAQLVGERDQAAHERAQEHAARTQAEARLAQTQTALAGANRQLQDTRQVLAQASNYLAVVRRDLAATQKRAVDTLAESRALAQKLAQWEALRLTVRQIVAMRRELDDVQKSSDALRRQCDQAKAELAQYQSRFGPFPPPAMTLRGRVLSVDPKWNFVVLDFQDGQEAKPNWELLVAREDRLIAKLRIVSVTGKRAIGNPIPGWDFSQIHEGDTVLPASPSPMDLATTGR